MNNPYFSGVMQAKQVAEDRQYEPMQKALAQLGSSIGRMPPNMPRKGLLNNLASFGPAIADANMTYANEERKNYWDQKYYELEERRLMDEQEQRAIRDQQRAEKHANEERWRERKFQQDQEKIAADIAYKQAKLAKKESADKVEVNGKTYDRIIDKKDLRDMRSHKQQLGNAKLQLRNIHNQLNDLKTIGKNNTFAPVGGVSKWTNPVKDQWGQGYGIESLQQETAIRKGLESELTKMNIALEKALTGRAMTQGMYDRLKASYPDINNDDLPTIQKKLGNLQEEVSLAYEAADASDKYGAYINPYDMIKHDTGSKIVPMTTPDGRFFDVPSEDVEAALQEGLEYE